VSQEICPKCLELLECGTIHLDGTPIYPGSRELHPIPRQRTCLACMPYKAPDDIEDRPPPAGFYRDLHNWRNEQLLTKGDQDD